MTSQELEVAIRECIRDIFKADYVGKLKATEFEQGWLITFGMITPEAPITLSIPFKDMDKILKFIKKDFQDRNIRADDFGYIQMTYFNNNSCIKKKCCVK